MKRVVLAQSFELGEVFDDDDDDDVCSHIPC